jgi:hypothetical protein
MKTVLSSTGSFALNADKWRVGDIDGTLNRNEPNNHDRLK